MGIDFAAIERESAMNRVSSPPGKVLTPEILGRIIAYAWQASPAGREYSLKLDDMFGFLLSEEPSSMPRRVADALHVENRVDGAYLEERTRLMIGAQSADVVGRLNPSHITPVFKADPVQASFLLKQHDLDYAEEIRWLRSAIDRFVEKASTT